MRDNEICLSKTKVFQIKQKLRIKEDKFLYYLENK